MRHAKAVLTALILLAAITSLCAQPEKAERDKVVIGVIGPMATPEGQAEEKAVKLAAEEINAQGGILGYKVEVVVGDTKLDSNTATSEFRRLATVENADVIIGGFSSGVMTAMMETMAETKTLFLSDASSPLMPRRWSRITRSTSTGSGCRRTTARPLLSTLRTW